MKKHYILSLGARISSIVLSSISLIATILLCVFVKTTGVFAIIASTIVTSLFCVSVYICFFNQIIVDKNNKQLIFTFYRKKVIKFEDIINITAEELSETHKTFDIIFELKDKIKFATCGCICISRKNDKPATEKLVQELKNEIK